MNNKMQQLRWFRRLRGSIVVLVLLSAIIANGQTYVSQDGRLLEANNRLGSFGYNSSADLNPLIPRVNDYITGNVTGGRSFQGVIPYQSTGEFQATLGTSTLNTFRRDSISRQDLAFGVIQPQRFLDSNRQVTSVYNGQIRSTGTTGIVYQSPVSQVYQPGQSSRVLSRDLSMPPLTTSANYNTLNVTGGYFGPQGQAPLSDRLYSPRMDQHYIEPAERDRFIREEALLQTERGADYETSADQPGPEDKQAAAGSDYFDLQRSVDPTPFERTMLQQAEARATIDGETDVDADPGAAPQDEQDQGFQTGQATPAPADGPGYGTDMSQEEFERRRAGVRRQAIQRHDERMQHGLDLLKMGKYYDAANVFDTALAFVPQSAPAFLGKAHALLGAGEFMSASYFLLRAMQLDPAVVRYGPALAEVFPQSAVLEKRIVELARWHERSSQPMLLLLQGYVEYRTGKLDEAENSLEKCLGEQPNFAPVQALLDAVRQTDDLPKG